MNYTYCYDCKRNYAGMYVWCPKCNGINITVLIKNAKEKINHSEKQA